jgi:hypothetical protein
MATEAKNFGLAKVKPDWDNWGIIDLEGNYVVEPNCHYLSDWKEGMLRIEKVASKIDVGGNWTNHYNGQYGFINSNGKMITDFSFGYVNNFSNGLAAVNKNKKWGFIDKEGQLIIPFQYDNVGVFGQEHCLVMLDNKWGLINRKGEWKLKNKFDSLSGFAFDRAIASSEKGLFFKEKHQYVIDTNGNKIVDIPKQWPWAQIVSDKLILIGTTSNYPGDRTYGFMNYHGKIITPPQFYTDSDYLFSIGEFSEGMLVVENRNHVFGFVNDNGEIEIPLQFESAGRFKNGIAKVSFEGESFYIDKQGTRLGNKQIPESLKEEKRPFDEVLQFSEGLAVARKGQLWGVINENNEVVIDFKFRKRIGRTVNDKGFFFSSHSPKFSCGLIGICEEREDTVYCGYMNASGEISIDLKFRVAEPFFQTTKDEIHR